MNLLLDRLDQIFSHLVTASERVLFFSIGGLPLIVLWLLAGGLFLTLRMGFINVWGFKHAIDIALGKYDESQDSIAGEVSPFQALATALSGSVGLGSIAGVAIAIQIGGPGAVFWMTMAALLGMSVKFVECTLGLKYRLIKPDGTTVGGPMYYLSVGLDKLGWPRLGKFLAGFLALAGIGAAFGGGNMFQSNQAFAAVVAAFPSLSHYDWLFGLSAAFLTGLVVVGGISRIGVVTSKLVPLMMGIYIFGCLWVLAVNFWAIPSALSTIIQEAFSPTAVEGGAIGVLVQGIRRGVFSHGAGLGTAAIAHAVARTQEPIREGIIAMLEPFIVTVIICNLTALVIITTGTYGEDLSGSALASLAFERVMAWSPGILAVIIVLFGLSTVITWSYYGERYWAYLLGESSTVLFKGLFLGCIFGGTVVNLESVVDFSDMMLLTMALPNLLGCLLLSGQVAEDLQNYWHRKRQEAKGKRQEV